jgi:tetratricopeptide (TPR) repeat protein
VSQTKSSAPYTLAIRPELLIVFALLLIGAVGFRIWFSSRLSAPRVAVGQGPDEARLRELKRDAEQHPDDPAAQLRLASGLLARREVGDAFVPLLRASRKPQGAIAASELLLQCGTEYGRYQEALPGLQNAVGALPQKPLVWANLVRALYALGQPGPAEAAQQEAERRFPGAPELAFLRAELLAEGGETRKAVQLYQTTLKRSPIAKGEVALGVLLARMHATQPAKEAFRRAVALDPASGTAYLGLAKTNLELGLTKDAEQAAFSGLQVAPDDPQAIFIVGLVLAKRGGPDDLRTAAELFERAVALNPEHIDAEYQLGALLTSSGDSRAAVRHLESVLQREPERLEARQAYARALRKAGRKEEAAQQDVLAQQLAELEQRRYELTSRVSQKPNDVNARCELGEFYLEHQAVPKAVREFERVLKTAPGHSRALRGLERARQVSP